MATIFTIELLQTYVQGLDVINCSTGQGSGDVQQDFAGEFEWEVGPDVWGEWWVCHLGIWLGGLGKLG